MQTREPDEKVIKFLEKLAMLDIGEKARLKRDAGKTIAEGQNMGLFYRLLPYGVPNWQEETYFLVATLYPMLQNGGTGNFGASLRQIRDPDPKRNNSLDRRVEILLDADPAQLPFRLRQAVRLIRSRNSEARINWQRLLEDLLQWNRPSRWVQENWARAYFEKPAKAAEKSQETTPSLEFDEDA
jgi:CRISPR type I-E-associated protein CasB/Cse2